MEPEPPFPPYSYVPGGPWPHPTASPSGHSAGQPRVDAPPIEGDDWGRSEAYLRGIALFNAGYYWEAHESWEALWHAHGRRGPTADLLKGLIKLAAAGVKVRERQPHGVATHARRAAEVLSSARSAGGDRRLGLDLPGLIEACRAIAQAPPEDPLPRDAPVSPVFDLRIEPS